MIREAKGVAIHDLSFWSSTLPLLDGLPRIIQDFQRPIGYGIIPMTLDAESGRILHDQVLESVQHIVSGDDDAHLPRPARRAGSDLLEYLSSFAPSGEPQVNVELAGCGIVLGGSCDLLWPPYLVELKLTAKEPGLRDVRQVLVYAALLHLAGTTDARVGIVANPRRAVVVEFEIEPLLMMTGGLTLDEFSSKLGQFLVLSGQSN